MTNLYTLLLTTIPVCFAQFSIQGPSDGNREAQGLRYSEEKGIEYGNQRESAPSDFSIQGASDGNSNFQIQGASDGNADFNIQAASDGHSQSSVQRPYDGNQAAQRALQYNDNGFQINWKSYGHGQQSQQAQQQPPQYQNYQQHYAAETAAAQHVQAAPKAPEPVQQVQTNVPAQHSINYRPYTNAPSQIKQILQFQSQIPYQTIIPEQYRFDALLAAQAQGAQKNIGYQGQGPQPSEEAQYNHKSRGHSRPKRQDAQYQGQASGQHQQQQQPQYKRIPQPSPEPQPQYSGNLPDQIQQILKYQSQIPYNIIANQIVYRPDKPYIPQPVAPPSSGNAATSYNQGQGLDGQYQGQGAYGQGRGSVRPVTEH